jgi:S-adenosylmethionine-dependent methyltransferase
VPDDRPRPRRAHAATDLRTAAVWAELSAAVEEYAARLGRPLRVVDLGGGTGGLSVPLAEAGHAVVVVDPSPDALASLRRRADECGVADRVVAVQGDSDSLPQALAAATGIAGAAAAPGAVGEAAAAQVDLVCCHGTLEHVDDPGQTLARIAEVLPEGGLLSLVTAQRPAAVLARALAGQFDRAAALLDSPDGRWGSDDPAPRRFDRSAIVALVEQAGLTPLSVHGVRILSDLVPSAHLDSETDRARLLALEQAIVTHREFAVLGELGAAVHVLARHG